jgi:hypothetical protein
MIILNDIQGMIYDKIAELNKFVEGKDIHFTIHGSSGQKLKGRTYATDIDAEFWARYKDNKRELFEDVLSIIDYMLKNNYYLKEFIAGEDERFIFDFDIRKSGKIINYDAKEIKDRFQDLYKKKVISEDELNELLEYVLEEPTLISFEKLKLVLEKYKDLLWTYKEIKKGKKKHRGKTFDLYNLFMKKIFLSNFILEYEKGKYILFDLSFRVVEYHGNTDISKIYRNGNILIKTKFYGELSRVASLSSYHGFFKNYVQEKYLKMLKRLRSIVTFYIFHDKNIESNSDEKVRDYENLGKIRYQITEKTKEFSCLNQIKNRIDIIVFFIESKIKDDLEIKRLSVELLKDTINFCNYSSKYSTELNNFLRSQDAIKILKNNNRDGLKELLLLFKKDVFSYVNSKALPELIYFYNRLKPFLPFDIVLPLPK